MKSEIANWCSWHKSEYQFCPDNCGYAILWKDKVARSLLPPKPVRNKIYLPCANCGLLHSRPFVKFCGKACRNQYRYKTASNQKLAATTLRSKLRSIILRGHGRPNNKMFLYLGCDAQFLRSHIQRQFTHKMSWENYGRNGWSIDHIIPCSLFDLTNEKHIQACFNWRNIRPLWHVDNIRKNARVDIVDQLLIDSVLRSLIEEVGVRIDL